MYTLFSKKRARSGFWMKRKKIDPFGAEEKSAVRASMKTLVPLICDTVQNGGTFRLITAGTSMKPLLRDRTDTVVLKKALLPLKRYDIALYRRPNGQYVLHRVIKCEKNGTYTLCGDNQLLPEKGVRDDAVIAVVSHIERGERTVRLDGSGYKIYVFFWCRCFFIRRFVLKLRAAYEKIKKHGK